MSGIVGQNPGRGSGVVGATAVGADAVDSANIADDAIDSEHYADGSIDNAHIADDAIDSEHYADGSIDNAHIADDAIDSEHYVDASIDNAHLADDAVGVAELSATGTASSSTFLRGDNAWAAPSGGGKVQQIVYDLDGDDANGTGTIPLDDSIPQQSSEGTEFMTLAITPTSATSVLRIDVHTSLTHSVSDIALMTALFKDSVENALAVSWIHAVSGNNYNVMTYLSHHIVAGSTSEQTFKVRCGAPSGTTYFNSRVSTPGGQMFGAVTQSSITITEYTPPS